MLLIYKNTKRRAHVRRARGFTLIEILVVIGMLAILSTVVLVAVNPLRQFAQARNTQRQNDVASILNAISERIADNGGAFIATGSTDGCASSLSATAQDVSKGGLDIRKCLVPTYISELPSDPSTGNNTCHSADCSGANESYDLHYTVVQDSTTNRITVCAAGAAETALPGSSAFCLSR